MIPFFKHTPKQEHNKKNAIQDRIAFSIVCKCISLQAQWARYMQCQTERLPTSAKKGFLIAFCLLSNGFSICLITKNLTNQVQKEFSVSNIKLPAYSDKTGDENTKPLIAITEEEIQKIQGFRRFMDSLASSPSGKNRLDQIIITRPGLMDSIRLIENTYRLKSPKK